ncbi:MAG TPA: hypothetical protein ENI42_05900, partial [Thermoplasmatales archaeon]|nr:hypothetical protein [Thermoplasmatales archaeon]
MLRKMLTMELTVTMVFLFLTSTVTNSTTEEETKGFSPGDILKVEYLGVDPPVVSYGEFDVAVFYMEYWSSVEGGVKIASKLFIPVGDAPSEGWPAKVWLHGFGGPGYDFWHWPFIEEDWRGRGYSAGTAFANHGIISLCPWVTGAGPSEPFATYSPLSLERNSGCAYDAFRALKNLPKYFEEHKEVAENVDVDVEIDYDRLIMSTNCISSPTLIYFASQLDENKDVKIRCLVADTFLPSVAYLSHYIVPYSLECNGLTASAS